MYSLAINEKFSTHCKRTNCAYADDCQLNDTNIVGGTLRPVIMFTNQDGGEFELNCLTGKPMKDEHNPQTERTG